MAENLIFKKGLLQNLPSTKQAGAIYVTTDERAMYIDISATERIRLGDFIEVANESDLQSAKYQPYSTTALYYVSNTNKLLKYKGTSGSEASFVVINSTSSIEANLTALTNRVSANETAITGLQTDLGNLTTTVTNNKASIEEALAAETEARIAGDQTNADAIAAEIARADAAEKANASNIAGLQTSVTNLDNNKADKTALEDEREARIAGDNTLTTNLGLVSDKVTALEGTVGDSTKGLVKDVSDLKVLTSQHNTTITQMQQDHTALAGIVSSNQGRLNTLETTVGNESSGLVKAVNDLQKSLGESQGDIGELTQKVSDIETKNSQQDTAISNLQNQVGTEPNASGEGATGLFLAVQNLQKKDISIDSEISNLKSKDEALEGRVKFLEDNSATKTELSQVRTDLTNFQNTVAETYVTKTSYNEKVGQLEAEDLRLAGLIDGHNTRIGNLETAVGDSSSGLIKDVNDLKEKTQTHDTDISNLQQNLNNYVLISKHNEDINALDVKITTNKNNIDSNKQLIDTNAANIATNAAGISANKTKADTNEIAISGILAEIGEASEANKDKTIHELIENLQTADNDIREYIDNNFAAADAMKFMGQISAVTELIDIPSSEVEAGHTYVLTVNSPASDGVSYAIGDLFIARTDGKNDSLEDWVHVPSGYVAAHDPKIYHSNTTDSDTIKLISGASSAHLGSIKFTAAPNTSTFVQVTNTNDSLNPVVTIGMQWGSF